MAHSTFGVTAAILQSDLLPHYTLSATSSPTDTRVAQIINRKAAIVSGLVDALGLNAAALDAAGEPIAFYFCQRLVLVGVAADVALAFVGRATSEGLVFSWLREWNDGLKSLRDPTLAKSMLSDALTTAHAPFIRTHIQESGDTPTVASDILVEDPVFTADMDL